MSFARPEPFESSFQDKIVGAIVVWAIVIALILAIVNEDYNTGASDFSSFYTTLSKAYGIKVGGPVVISGVSIGSIQQISLTDDALVKVVVSLDNQYAHFYTEGSKLAVETTIGLDSVLSGVGLVFQSSGVNSDRIQSGGYIEAIEPKSLQQILDEWKIDELARDVQSIVKNINKTLETVGENQQNLSGSLKNASLLLESLVQSAQKIPDTLDQVDQIAGNTNRLINNLDANLASSNADVSELLANTNAVLKQVDVLTQNLVSSSEVAPELLENMNLVTQRTARLMTKLNNHWLLGGGEQPASM